MRKHQSSLDFFTEASGHLWKNWIPADEADVWTKNIIWVLCTTGTPSDGFPSKAEYEGINQFQISYADFVRKGIIETGLADIDTRGPSDGQPIDMLTKKALLALAKEQGIQGVSHYNVDGLRAVVKLHMGIEPTKQELAAKAQDEAEHQANLTKKKGVAQLQRLQKERGAAEGRETSEQLSGHIGRPVTERPRNGRQRDAAEEDATLNFTPHSRSRKKPDR
jgi:hypothetical protein